MLIAPKRLKLRTSCLTYVLPGTVRTWHPLIFPKRGVFKNLLGGDMHSHERLLVITTIIIDVKLLAISVKLSPRTTESLLRQHRHWYSQRTRPTAGIQRSRQNEVSTRSQIQLMILKLWHNSHHWVSIHGLCIYTCPLLANSTLTYCCLKFLYIDLW